MSMNPEFRTPITYIVTHSLINSILKLLLNLGFIHTMRKPTKMEAFYRGAILDLNYCVSLSLSQRLGASSTSTPLCMRVCFGDRVPFYALRVADRIIYTCSLSIGMPILNFGFSIGFGIRLSKWQDTSHSFAMPNIGLLRFSKVSATVTIMDKNLYSICHHMRWWRPEQQ